MNKSKLSLVEIDVPLIEAICIFEDSCIFATNFTPLEGITALRKNLSDIKYTIQIGMNDKTLFTNYEQVHVNGMYHYDRSALPWFGLTDSNQLKPFLSKKGIIHVWGRSADNNWVHHLVTVKLAWIDSVPFKEVVTKIQYRKADPRRLVLEVPGLTAKGFISQLDKWIDSIRKVKENELLNVASQEDQLLRATTRDLRILIVTPHSRPFSKYQDEIEADLWELSVEYSAFYCPVDMGNPKQALDQLLIKKGLFNCEVVIFIANDNLKPILKLVKNLMKGNDQIQMPYMVLDIPA